MPAKILFTIDPKTAVVTMEVDGVIGPACTEITKPFREALDGEALEDIKKEVFYEAPAVVTEKTTLSH